ARHLFATPESDSGTNEQQIKQIAEIIPFTNFQETAVKIGERIFLRYASFRAADPKSTPTKKLTKVEHRIEYFFSFAPHFFHIRLIADFPQVFHCKTDIIFNGATASLFPSLASFFIGKPTGIRPIVNELSEFGHMRREIGILRDKLIGQQFFQLTTTLSLVRSLIALRTRPPTPRFY